MKKQVFSLFVILTFISIVGAVNIVDDEKNLINGVSINSPPQRSFNNNTQGVNSSAYTEIWITNEGDMDNIPDLYPTLNTTYLAQSGSNANQNIDIGNNNITVSGLNLGNDEKITFGSGSSRIEADIDSLSGQWHLNSPGGTTGFQFTAGSNPMDFFGDGDLVLDFASGDITATTTNFIINAAQLQSNADIVMGTGENILLKDIGLLIFGTGNDANIQYDGTNLLIEPANVGSGNVIIGHTSDPTSYDAKLFIANDGTGRHLQTGTWTNSASGVSWLHTKSRGASIGSHSAVQADDNIGGIILRADDGTNYDQVVRLRGFAEGISSGNIEGRWEIEVADSSGSIGTTATFYSDETIFETDVEIRGKLNVSESIEYNGTLITHSPFVVYFSEENKYMGFDPETEQTDWCVKSGDSILCKNGNQNIINKINSVIERNELKQQYINEDKSCVDDSHSFVSWESYKRGERGCYFHEDKAIERCESLSYRYWDKGSCKENIYLKCLSNRTADWNFETSSCNTNPIKLCEGKQDMVWDRNTSSCKLSLERQNQRLMSECLLDRSKYWNGNACINIESLRAL